MAKLSNIRSVGRFKNEINGKAYNIYKGRNIARKTDVLFYLYRGKRMFVSDADFYSHYKPVILKL